MSSNFSGKVSYAPTRPIYQPFSPVASASTSTPSLPITTLPLSPKSSRMTPTHIFFWHGPLSNWNLGATYSGKRCFDLLLPELDSLGIAHPPSDAFSTPLLASFPFVCGEQWMMAMKGWLFETSLKVGAQIVDDEGEFQKLRAEMLSHSCNASHGSNGRMFYDSTICKILRSKSPKEHKGLGRKAQGFDNAVWEVASFPVVVACSVARAEVDEQLRAMYLLSGTRKFVEGSPTDIIWGVGIRWDKPEIEDEELWVGENRLGRCHDAAREIIRGLQEAKEKREKQGKKVIN